MLSGSVHTRSLICTRSWSDRPTHTY